jgi:50S ribosomal protein L16 3-hydroxylase
MGEASNRAKMPELYFPEGLNPERFLRDYWQQHPLPMPAALSGYRCPITPEELAGLACEEEIESRIVFEKHGSRPWEALTGPFDEELFARLPSSHWTLLVQDVDKHLDEITDLLEPFRFIPDWRLDDIMISYAVDQGSVGPHIDDYDVFLIQVRGKRRWLVDSRPGDEENHIPGLDLRILREFDPEHDWLMQPGDVLYLPPNVPHWGIAQGDDCMTCSVGFRAPSLQEMLAAWSDELIQQTPTRRYRDAGLSLQKAHGEIMTPALTQISSALNRFLSQPEEMQHRWFGRFISEPKSHLEVDPLETPVTTEDFHSRLNASKGLRRNGWSRMAFIRGNADVDYLFVNGEEFPVKRGLHGFIETLTDSRSIDLETLRPFLHDAVHLNTLTELFNLGHLLFDE